MAIAVEHVSKTFYTHGQVVPVLADICFTVNRGELVSIIGPSGSGKTTLFNILAGVETPDTGRVLLDGRPNRLGDTAYMLQKDLLFPWRTVLDNAILGMEIQGVPWQTAVKKAQALMERFGLKGFERFYPHRLSGGMRQRAALMRTILCGKPILLLDEPFGALDALTRQKMHVFLQEIWQEFERTILFITHDIDEAVLLSDRVMVLTAQRPATIERHVIIDLPRPRTPQVAVEPAYAAAKRELLELVTA